MCMSIQAWIILRLQRLFHFMGGRNDLINKHLDHALNKVFISPTQLPNVCEVIEAGRFQICLMGDSADRYWRSRFLRRIRKDGFQKNPLFKGFGYIIITS